MQWRNAVFSYYVNIKAGEQKTWSTKRKCGELIEIGAMLDPDQI